MNRAALMLPLLLLNLIVLTKLSSSAMAESGQVGSGTITILHDLHGHVTAWRGWKGRSRERLLAEWQYLPRSSNTCELLEVLSECCWWIDEKTQQTPLQPAIMLKRGGIKVGILGLAYPHTPLNRAD